jgi:transcriptional regulator with XRE-family HTH domain
MTRASIANIETGKQRVLAKTLVDLAGVLGAEVADLLPPPVERGKQKPVDLQAELAKALPPDAAIDDLAKTIRGGQRRQKT